MLEYCCPVWHSSLTINLSDKIERVQNRTQPRKPGSLTCARAPAKTLVPSGHVNPQILGVIRIAASLPLREEWYGEFKSENENIYNYAYGKYVHLRSVLTHILGFVGFYVIFYEICHRLKTFYTYLI